MSKIVFFSLAALLLLSFAMFTVIKTVDANPLPPSWMGYVDITIESPLNETYGLPVLAKFSAYSPPYYYLSGTQTSGWTGDFFYVLDGQDMGYSGIKIKNVEMVQDSSRHPYKNLHNFTGQTYLTELTPGMHNITIYWGFEQSTNNIRYNPTWSRSSQFSVDSAPTSNFSNFALPFIAASTLIAAITTGILVYFRKQKRIGTKQTLP